MFTGLVEEKAVVQDIKTHKNLCVLKIKAKKILKNLKVGDSVAINGVCLTLTEKKQGVLSFDIMKETMARTTLKNLGKGSLVNLERALKMGDPIGGHFVAGHVDGIGRIKKWITKPNYVELQITPPRDLMRFFAPRGSVSVDGVSLTIGDVKKSSFSVYLIPHTLKETTLGEKKAKRDVNIETDILAKYILAQQN